MQSGVGAMIEFTSAKPIVWSAGWRTIMQVESHPPKADGLGHCFGSKNSRPEVKHAGLNVNSSSRADDDSGG